MRNPAAIIQPDAFIHTCLDSILHLIPGAVAAFYLPDNPLVPQHILNGLSAEIHRTYLQEFLAQHTLHPQRVNQRPVTIARRDESRHTTVYYRQLMMPNAIKDMTEIYVRQRQGIVAGLSLMRDRPFTLNERRRLWASLPLLELATEELLPRERRCDLTPKEQQIVSLIREGACNKRIALRLDISLSTVKTHLRNIFAKTHARNRTELVAGMGMGMAGNLLSAGPHPAGN